jgi:hypothetical protein
MGFARAARRLAGTLYRTPPDQWLRHLGRMRLHAAGAPPDADFLRSAEYRELMSRHLPCDGSHDLHEAQNETRSFRFRHHEARERLGVFRWRGLQRHRDQVLSLLAPPDAFVLDFGGAACPLGLGSYLVDPLPLDVHGRVVSYRSLAACMRKPTAIFSSHALEHVPDLEGTLRAMSEALAPEGTLVLHLPAYTCERWRAGVHRHAGYHDHVWTFGLAGSQPPPGLQRYVEIDQLAGKHFGAVAAEYCGDDSLFIVAREPLSPPRARS